MRNILVFAIAMFMFFAANASGKSNLTFDFSNMTLNSSGIYNPKVDGAKSGISAELIARRNGIDSLGKYFESSCDGFDKSTLDIRRDWENNFHSQGTEIYANGVLEVALQGEIKQIFKISTKAKKNIKMNNGRKIYFQIPDNIPLSAIRCGTVEINLGNDKKMHAFPIDSVKPSAETSNIIHLSFNSTASDLELDQNFKDSNTKIIEDSVLSKMEELSSEIVPIIVVINNKT